MDYYIHYSDGTTETRHWCDRCDERQAVLFTENEQLCKPCQPTTNNQ
jgi:hypothetical protein